MLRIRVVAPFKLRCERIMRQVNLPTSRAEERVRRSDAENAWFYRHFFGLDWNGLDRYGLAIDAGRPPVREAAAGIAAAMAGLHETASAGGGLAG